MNITLLTPHEYDILLELQKNHPKLTFQNKGYQYIDRSIFSEEDKYADAKVQVMLAQHIADFVSFDNFRIGTDRISRKEELSVRFQYHYSPSFTGVGYITLRELHEGFDDKEPIVNEIKSEIKNDE